MRHLIYASVLVALTASCGSIGSSKSSDSATDSAAVKKAEVSTAVDGEWVIENVVVNDTLYARPKEETPGTLQTFTFHGNDYSVATNCNGINGTFTVNGDSLILHAGSRTEMACENMRVEDLIVQVIPQITTYDLTSDSTLRLNSGGEAYISLKKIN